MSNTEALTLSRWRSSGKIFISDGFQIFYQDEGRGEVLLCIHGFPTASWDWHLLWPDLTKRFRVVAPDMLGFGFSDKPKQHEYSILAQAALLKQLLRALGITTFHILAHDYGDTVAQELLAQYEEARAPASKEFQIKSLCFLNGGLFPETHHPRLIQKMLLSPLGPMLSRLLSQKSFSKSFSAVFGPHTKPSAAELEEFWFLINYNAGKRLSHKLLHYMPERKKHRSRWVGAMQQTHVPLRLIDGTADPISGEHMVKRYEALVPNANVVRLQGIGHYPQVESPRAVSKAVFAFIV
ncbi:alpha/beta hydrolase [candidate division KSB1 bacterium]|nr:alpha/beta hydrolase [candidate division KSB1 bacterium]